MKVKICGIKTLEHALTVVDAGADYIGFIFFKKSPRYITPEDAAVISKEIKGKIKIVAVVVDASDDELEEIVTLVKPDLLQLHGKESVERCKEVAARFKISIIKAISVKYKTDLAAADEYEKIATYILFDAKPPKDSELPGGNSVSFDWGILKKLLSQYRWILSGGLNSSNIAVALGVTKAKFVDVSSGVESSPGVKDHALIRKFIALAKQ